MSDKPPVKGYLNRKLEDPEYRKQHDERYAAFKLEVQILLALEDRDWTYSDLAKATKTSKSNISRDLKDGGLVNASFSRIHRMADALGMKLVGVLIPKESVETVLPKIEELVRSVYRPSSKPGRFEVGQSDPPEKPGQEKRAA